MNAVASVPSSNSSMYGMEEGRPVAAFADDERTTPRPMAAFDIVDALRDQPRPAGYVKRFLEWHGFGFPAVARAIFHYKEPCGHESGGAIGTLPRYPSWRKGLNATDDDIHPNAVATWQAIEDANHPPQFFSYGGQATWVKAHLGTSTVVETIEEDRMMFLMGEVGDWSKQTLSGTKRCRPPRAIAKHLVADPHPPLPRLNRLVTTPVFDHGGRLVASAGYHADSGLFVATQDLAVPRVAHSPSGDEVEEAKGLLGELIEDFPFVGEADRANALALLVLPFVRDLIDGPTPLHLIDKPTPGSGGTLLAQALLYPALGERVDSTTVPDSDSEVQRRLTAALMGAPQAVLFDNLKRLLDSQHIASVLTASTWRDRQIRTSTYVRLPVSNAWVATGNKVSVSDEIARRTLPVRLDTKMERPWERKGFHHDDLIGWVKANRERLIWAALTLVQAWVAEGMPSGSLNVGMYENWSRVMSGIFEAVDIPGLRANWQEWFDGRPSTENRNRRALSTWWQEFGVTEVKAAQLLPAIGPLFDIPDDGSRSSATMLGAQLKRFQAADLGEFQLVGRDVSGSTAWRLTRR